MKNFNKYIFSILLFVGLSNAQILDVLTAPKFSISGKVVDIKEGTPLVGANVYLAGTSHGTATTEDGFYNISGVREGSYLVKVTYIGYKTFEDSITILGEDLLKDFTLSYTSIQGEEVVVTGQAKGQMDAINRQLASKSLKNVVSSDRIQELPDANAAESVARIPGVTIKREGGEGNKVVIRGLSPKYNAVTVDGTRLASTDPDDRSTDLSMISQYMLDGIELTKAGTPDNDGDVLGGTVNFILKKAKPGLHADVIAQGMHNGLRETYNDNKIVLSVGNRFWKDRIGAFGQLDFENRNRGSNELGAWYTNPGAKLDSINPLTLAGMNITDVLRKNKRENSLMVLDFEIPKTNIPIPFIGFQIPTKGNISYSYLNSSISKDITNYSDSFTLGNNGRGHTSGTNDNQINVITQTFKYKQSFFNSLHFDAYFSSSESTNDRQTYSFVFDETMAYTIPTNKITGVDNIFEVLKNDTTNMALNNYSFNYVRSNELEKTNGINLQYDFKITRFLSGNIKFGNKFRTKTRTYDKNHEYAPVAAAAGLAGPRAALEEEFPRIAENRGPDARRLSIWAFINDNYDSSNFMKGRYPLGPAADLDFMMEIFQFFRENYGRYSPGASTIDEYIMHRIHETNTIQNDYSGEEDYSANYAMIDLDILSKLNIIYGERTEINKTNYNSWRSYKTPLPHWVFTGRESRKARENEYFLPALFIKFNPVSWLTLRYASTKTLTRPNYTDIIPFWEIDGPGSGVNYKTSDLSPGVSENTDYSVSVNNNYLGFFTITYFEKTIADLIYNSGSRYIINPREYGLPSGTRNYIMQNYTFNNPFPVSLKGMEFDWQTRFWYLPGPLRGLVLNANYTVTESEVQYPRTILEYDLDWSTFPPTLTTTNIDTFYTDRLIDQPNEIINLSIGYDYKGFSGRLSMLHKSNIFLRTDFWPELRVNTDDYTRWDLSMKQDLPIDGLSVFLNVNNITEEVDINRFKYNSLSYEQHYGRTADLGFRYAF